MWTDLEAQAADRSRRRRFEGEPAELDPLGGFHGKTSGTGGKSEASANSGHNWFTGVKYGQKYSQLHIRGETST